jgi:hypothetical protein
VAGHPDLVKIWVDDLLGTSPKMKPEIYQAVIDEAHRAGVRVAAHIYYLEDAKAVLRAGADIIAHGVRDKPVDAEFINEMKARSAWYIPTINLDECSYIFAGQPAWTKEPFFQNALQPALKARLNDPAYLKKTLKSPRVPIFKRAVATNQANVKALYDAGPVKRLNQPVQKNPIKTTIPATWDVSQKHPSQPVLRKKRWANPHRRPTV